jgi:hypothetical protein
MLALSLVVLLGGTLAVNAAAAPTRLTAAQSTPTPPPPLPLPTVDSCPPGSPLPICNLPTSTTPPGTSAPAPTTPACTGEGLHPAAHHLGARTVQSGQRFVR